MQRFEEGEYDAVELAYTQFISAGVQRVQLKRFVPLETDLARRRREVRRPVAPTTSSSPAPARSSSACCPRYAEARLYAALLEGSASFFAAQQRAMKSATDNAEELITKLSRVMNRARQDAITTEIMEIVGGAEALRQGQTGGSDLLADKALDVVHVGGQHTDHLATRH